MTNSKLLFSLCLLAPTGLLQNQAQAGPYEKLSRDVSQIAKQSGYTRIAVLPFRPISSGSKRSGLALSERLISRLAGREGLQVVERTLLDGVLKEQRLSYKGMIDPRQAKEVGRILGVDAIVTGTFLKLRRDRLEIHMRLVDAQTARILGAGTAQVEKEWEEDSIPSDEVWNVRPPDINGFPAPRVRLIPDPFRGNGGLRDALGSRGRCGDWEKRARALQKSTLKIKARYWAARLHQGLSARSLKRNPGSEIRSLSQRQEFYRLTKELYRTGYKAGITVRERELMRAADRKVEAMADDCY